MKENLHVGKEGAGLSLLGLEFNFFGGCGGEPQLTTRRFVVRRRELMIANAF
jgi:hypothetical protein